MQLYLFSWCALLSLINFVGKCKLIANTRDRRTVGKRNNKESYSCPPQPPQKLIITSFIKQLDYGYLKNPRSQLPIHYSTLQNYHHNSISFAGLSFNPNGVWAQEGVPARLIYIITTRYLPDAQVAGREPTITEVAPLSKCIHRWPSYMHTYLKPWLNLTERDREIKFL